MESVVDGNGGGSRPVVMAELSRIKELVKQLDVHLRDCPDLCKRLAEQIFSVTERSIGMIRSGSFDGQKRSAIGAGLDSLQLSTTPSPLSGVSGMPFRTNKKRKMVTKGKHQVRVSSAGGGAETLDDGYSWRKYGQKKILGAQHPRGYYRCTYRKTQGCAATKQVQRADEDPTLFDVTYHDTHTCLRKTATAAANVQLATPNLDARSTLKSLSSSLTVNTDGLTSGPQQSTPSSFSAPSVSGLTPLEHYPLSTPWTSENCFQQGVSLSPSRLELSPATSDSSYNSMNPLEAESELEKMVSELVAAASTPAPSLEETAFSQDRFELLDFDPNFDVSVFFV